MQKKRATLWLNAALFLAVAALGYGLTIYFDGASMPARAETETKPLPDFSFTDLSGKTRSVHDFKNKIVIINFWATWCAPCRMRRSRASDAYAWPWSPPAPWRRG